MSGEVVEDHGDEVGQEHSCMKQAETHIWDGYRYFYSWAWLPYSMKESIIIKNPVWYMYLFFNHGSGYVIDFTKRYDYGNQTHNLFMFCYQSSSCFVQLICFSCVIWQFMGEQAASNARWHNFSVDLFEKTVGFTMVT